jgi:DNA-binding PadR family transcriptional regulator
VAHVSRPPIRRRFAATAVGHLSHSALLTDEPRHGYAIIQDVEERTAGELHMSAGTLYRSIARMVEQGLITEVAKRAHG